MPHRLLLADDSITIQKVIELTFADEKIEVVAVSDGDQAIDRVANERFDVVLADIGMPMKDGFEVAAFVKGHPGLEHVPVILLTGAFDPVDDARVAAVGAAAVLRKPFEPQVLVSRVRDLLRSAKPPAPPAGTPGVPDKTAPRLAPASESPAMPSSSGAAVTSVDEYFERLDRAFASLNVPLEPRELTRFPRAVPPPEVEVDRVEAEPELAPLTEQDSDAVTLAAPGVPANGDGEAEALPPRIADPGAQPVRPHESPLARKFATLLAVERGELPASAIEAPSDRNEDALVDRIVRRVVEQLSDRAVRDLATEIVSRTAERLVREEIDRIKSGA